MDSEIFEALQAPGTLEKTDKGKVLVKNAMIQLVRSKCESLDNLLASIPQTLAKYELADYATEGVQREILTDGASVVVSEVMRRTRIELRKSGLFPALVEELARRNADCISRNFRDEIKNLCDGIRSLRQWLSGFGIVIGDDDNSLWFRSGKLRVAPKILEGIAPRFTIPVGDKDLKLVKKLREVADLLKDIQSEGITVLDAQRQQGAAGLMMIQRSIVSQMVEAKMTDEAVLTEIMRQRR